MNVYEKLEVVGLVTTKNRLDYGGCMHLIKIEEHYFLFTCLQYVKWRYFTIVHFSDGLIE